MYYGLRNVIPKHGQRWNLGKKKKQGKGNNKRLEAKRGVFG